ncbi:hypothetical protein ACQJBY_039810 [Aegilops geniculata]
MAAFAAVTMPLPGRVSGSRRRVVAQASATMATPAGRTHYEVLGVGAGPAAGRSRRRTGAWPGKCTRTPSEEATARGSSGCARPTPRWPTPTSARATIGTWPAARRR